MLKTLFEEIKKNPKYFAQAANGKQFEENLKFKLEKHGFREIRQRSQSKTAILNIYDLEKENFSLSWIKKEWKEIKEQILAKNSTEVVLNKFTMIKNVFIFQPYGSQQFPDFLIFTKKYILPIEIKYSLNEKKRSNLDKFKPMWNSNMPKPNAIYLYGVTGEGVTFFKGDDILDWETRKVLLDFFVNLDKEGKKNLNSQLETLKNNFGLYPYIRKAYGHKKEYSTYKNLENEQKIESFFSENQQKREKNVIYFLEKLNIEEEKLA